MTSGPCGTRGNGGRADHLGGFGLDMRIILKWILNGMLAGSCEEDNEAKDVVFEEYLDKQRN